MTVGSAIFWSVVLVVLAVTAYQLSVRRKWKVVGKIFGGLVLVAVVASGGLWAWNRYENRPRVVEMLDGVRLGMSPLDVKLLKGASNNDATATPERTDGEYRLVWFFKPSDFDPRLGVIFYGKETDRLKVAIVCETDGYNKVLGLGRFSSEEEVTAKLGQPTETSIAKDGLAKLVSFKPYKIAFRLSKGQVSEVCISESGAVAYAEEYQADQAQKRK